ncbi:MAG TPA: Dabb family protein [Dehalococcoidia bacterium]|nr:Dabb family protein [Dehalococcoidia bacterium]
MSTVRHVVLVKFKEDATGEEKQKFIERSSFGKSASFVSNFACGWGVDPNPYASASEQWDWALTLDLPDGDSLRYANDPEHRAAGAEIAGLAEKFAILDFVIE